MILNLMNLKPEEVFFGTRENPAYESVSKDLKKRMVHLHLCVEWIKQNIMKWSRTLWSLPATMSSACLLSVESFSQRISLIREIRNAETKENSQRSLNSNDVVIKPSQGPLVLSQGYREYPEPHPMSYLTGTKTSGGEVNCMMTGLYSGHEFPQFWELASIRNKWPLELKINCT